MAQNFLAQLPRVAKEDISKESTCIVCREEYGTAPSDGEPAEEAVRLPCPGGHIVGFVCISSWLSSERNRNTCPLCRHELFAFPCLPQNEIEWQSEYGRRFERWLDEWHIIRSHLRDTGCAPERILQWSQWFSSWGMAAVNVNEDGIAHASTARTNLLRQRGWSQMPADTRAVHWSETESSFELEPLASAIQTLHFRELFLYVLHCSRSGFNLVPPRRPTSQLTRQRRGSLYRHLCRIGAFEDVLEEVENKEERWDILRSQGYAWDDLRAIWSACPY